MSKIVASIARSCSLSRSKFSPMLGLNDDSIWIDDYSRTRACLVSLLNWIERFWDGYEDTVSLKQINFHR